MVSKSCVCLSSPAIDFSHHWVIGGRRLGTHGHAGPHWLSLPATVPDHTRCRAASFSSFSAPPEARIAPAKPHPLAATPGLPATPPQVAAAAAKRAKRGRKQRKSLLRELAADVHALREPLLQLALGDTEMTIKICPGDPASWCARAEARAALGEWSGANSDFAMALTLQPSYAPARDALGRERARFRARKAQGRRYVDGWQTPTRDNLQPQQQQQQQAEAEAEAEAAVERGGEGAAVPPATDSSSDESNDESDDDDGEAPPSTWPSTPPKGLSPLAGRRLDREDTSTGRVGTAAGQNEFSTPKQQLGE